MRKSIFASVLALSAVSAFAAEPVITLDLTKATTPLSFKADNGSWTDTYNDDAESIDSQCFSFVHSSMGDYFTWWGFTASNSCDNSRHDDTITYQFSNMAKGGIVLNDDGSVKLDKSGAPVTSADVPYIVGFYNAYFAARPTDIAFVGGKAYNAVGVYVNLNSYAYYSVECGDSFARAFTNGDRFVLTIHGVDPDGSERSVDVDLASYSNGDLTINRGWKYVDLTPLGVVNELYFTMTSTDSGAYGMNTPGYFCLDKLMVTPHTDSVTDARADGVSIAYCRDNSTVTVSGHDFAMIYDAVGRCVASFDGGAFDISSFPAGVYVVKAAAHSLKIVK